MGIAEQMGRVLERLAVSVNIKERLDFACAFFPANGGLVANTTHIPVYLGAIQSAVKAQIDHWRSAICWRREYAHRLFQNGKKSNVRAHLPS